MQRNPKYAFTVFTPTFNRAHTLPRVYNSLLQQTFKDFEWLIVDDGSWDNTSDVVSSFRQTSKFPIRYLWQQHTHKTAAYNFAVPEAQGILFLGFDSDDECVPTALERFWWHWNNIPVSGRDQYSGVTALCTYADGRLVGKRFPCVEWRDGDSIEMAHGWKTSGDKWGFQRTDIMRRFPFPEDIHGFIPEGVVWTQISLHYKTRFVNEVLRIYHQSPDALSRSRGPMEEIAPGGACWMRSIFRYEAQYLRYDPKWFVRCAINFTRFHLHCGESPLHKAFGFRWMVTALLLAAYPLGWLAYLLDYPRKRLRSLTAVESLGLKLRRSKYECRISEHGTQSH
jgi:glycosyltransferase involved in cell wall biosynthesis